MVKWRYAGIPAWREVSNHLREPLWEVFNCLENLWRGLYWILKISLSPKDQRELFVPFSKYRYSTVVLYDKNCNDTIVHIYMVACKDYALIKSFIADIIE